MDCPVVLRRVASAVRPKLSEMFQNRLPELHLTAQISHEEEKTEMKTKRTQAKPQPGHKAKIPAAESARH